MSPAAASATPKPSVLQLALPDQNALYAAYMPMLAQGGVFVPTQRSFCLGENAYVLLQLPDEPRPYTVAGKVVWVTPEQAAGNRPQGIGVQFAKSAESAALKRKIEELLGALLASDRPTHSI